jgi:hypothetical protein
MKPPAPHTSPGRIHPGGAARHARPRPALRHDRTRLRVICVGAATVGLGGLVALVHPLPAWCAAVAITVRLTSSGQYALAVARGRARPNIVTWFLWGLTPMIAVAAQLGDGTGPAVAVTFVLGLGPLVVSVVAFFTDRSASRLTPFTLSCAAASFAGIVFWQLTAMPALAIAFCILADLLATLPTLHKAYLAPESEYAPPYLLSVLAMLVTLGTVDGGGFTAYGFPLYMLLINVTLFAFAALPLARLARRPATAAAPRHGIPPGFRVGDATFAGFPVSTPDPRPAPDTRAASISGRR